jgi:hypothetical protein
MKKLLLFSFLAFGALSMQAQLIYSNGPMVNLPNGGAGGANVSHLHGTLNTFGYGHSVAGNLRIGDDFTIPSGQSWRIDTLVFFAYQTNSGMTSTINQVNIRIWQGGTPNTPSANLIFGDSTINFLSNTKWSGIYRTTSTAFTAVDRPIMRNACETGSIVLPAGTYWLDWQTAGSGSLTGPWAPVITITGQQTTGNAMQRPGSGAFTWRTIYNDTTALTDPQGFPFEIKGSILTGVNEVKSLPMVTITPNPVKSSALFRIDNSVVGKNMSIVIYDALGKQVRVINNITSNEVRVNRDNLAEGLYMYELISDSKSVAKGKMMVN